MGWAEAIAAVSAAAKTVMDRVWGEQTSAEASLQKRAEHAAAQIRQAATDLQAANDEEPRDAHKVADAVDRLGRWRAELRRLHDEAASKRD